MFGNLDNPEINSNFSYANLASLINQENDSNSINLTPMNISQISESNNSFDNLYLIKNENNKINTIKNENQQNKEENIKSTDEEKLMKDKESNEIKEKSISTQNSYSLTIIKILNIILESIRKGEFNFDGLELFQVIQFCKNSMGKEMAKIASKGNNMSKEDANGLLMLMDRADLLDEIQKFKINERDENIEKDEIIFLKEKLILFLEEKEFNIGIRRDIKTEAGNDPQPLKVLNISIKKFIINCLEKKIKFFMESQKEEKNEEIKNELNEKIFLEKKRKNSDDGDDDEDSSNSSESEKNIKRKRYRSDNISNMFKRNLIQKIFLEWINYGEEKNNRIQKLDPIIFMNSSNFKGKKLKEIYSKNISIKSKNLDRKYNIHIINEAKGIKNVKLNFSFEQALKLFYYRTIDENEIIEIIKNLNENVDINEANIIEGLKSKEEFIVEKAKRKKPCFENKLRNVISEVEKKYLAK